MKRILLLMMAMLVLSACGKDEVKKDEGVEKENPTENIVDTNEELDEGMLPVTDDPLEAGNKNGGIDVFDREGEHFLIKERYTNEDTDEDGFNIVDFNGYEIKYSIALIENFEEKDLIAVFAEVTNNTEFSVQFNQGFEFVTDTQDQVELGFGITNNKPNTKDKFFNYGELNYGIPEKLTVEIYPPFRDEGFENYDEDEFGETVEFEFTKE